MLRSYGRLAVAFSGGADSSLLLKAALETLGPEQVLALFAHSELLKEREIDRVRLWAEQNGYGASLALEVVEMRPLASQEFVHNGPDRCYVCKRMIYRCFLERIIMRGIKVLVDGTNSDDLQAHRPGRRAMNELGIHTPLAELGLTKADVRALGKMIGLSNWHHPSSSCLATRISPGLEITAERLRWIEQAEESLARLGIDDCRVQLVDGAGETVIIHVNEAELARLLHDGLRASIVRALKNRGASRVLVNLEGR